MHELRHVFITHFEDYPDLPGPSREAAAAAMLNSPPQWRAHYDLNRQRREARTTAEGMAAWRQGVLQQGAAAGASAGAASTSAAPAINIARHVQPAQQKPDLSDEDPSDYEATEVPAYYYDYQGFWDPAQQQSPGQSSDDPNA